MKRPLIVLAAGFVLGEVLALQGQKAVSQGLLWWLYAAAGLFGMWSYRISFPQSGGKRQGSSAGKTALLLFFMGFSLLSMSEFFVFRKMETCETKNHPLCGCESRSYTKSPFRFIIEVSKPLSKKGKVIYMAKKANDLAHTKWMCKYHIVFTPKYRRKVIYNQYKEDLRDILKQLCSYKGVEILEGKLMPDHVHMLVAIPPKYSVSSFMGYLKGKSALMMFDRHANLKYKFGNRHFWSEGYYVSTVGLNEDTIRKYIKEQERYDQMVDKLSVKEYEDPFKG